MKSIDDTSKRSRVLSSLKERLRNGRWKPGTQLPTRTELIKTLKISPMTLQLVINDLIRDGFVSSHGRDGTFAAQRPPFVRNFGFVINGPSSERKDWIHYWRVLEVEAKKHFEDSERQSVFYYGINRPLSTDMDRLRNDIEAQKLAGVFFSDMPRFLFNDLVFGQKHTPLVAVGSKSTEAPQASVVVLGTDKFFEVALKQIAEAGRRRVGLITPWEDPRQHVAQFQAISQRMGLKTHPRWCQYAPHSIDGRRWASHAVQAIVAAHERPDALVIFDDNHTESVMSGVLAAGCSVPNDCLVVAHANFPWPVPSPYPLIRIGVDIRRVIQIAVGEIERRQHGEDPQQLYVPLQIQTEL